MTNAALLHWALLDIIQVITTTGYQIIVHTNNPCHLWMRWTNVTPQKHIILVEVRGAPIDKGARYCFVVYEDNEQEQAGDTLEHTFIKQPWAGCETRWFYFFGTVDSLDSPSETPLFTKHRPLGLLFAEPYTTEHWIPALPFYEHYTINDQPSFTLLFLEPYSW